MASPTVSLDDLRPRLIGALACPGDPGYELARPWNLAVDVHPLAVVAVAVEQDVVEVVRFARDHGLRIAAQRTGHGAVAYGDDTILIYTGGLDTLELDLVARRARLGAGVLWEQVIEAAAPHGLAPLAGSSPSVGAVGFLTGAGIGPLVRTFGLSSDSVRAFDVVTGDGRRLRVSADEHPEVFWGLRGGKGALGIVCSVEIDLLQLAEIHGGALYFDGADAATVLHGWREWASALPEHASTSVALLRLPPLEGVPEPLAGRLTVAVRFASTAGDAECAALLAPLRALAATLIDTIGPMPYAALGSIHADPVDPMPVHESAGLLRELPAEAVDQLLTVADPSLTMIELRLLGGAYAREPETASAFSHRDAAFTLLALGVLAGPDAGEVPGHAAAVIGALEPWATGGELPNFGASADPERIARCYDADSRAWLAALAERHDPDGVLHAGLLVRD